jgi:hypothetical protein
MISSPLSHLKEIFFFSIFLVAKLSFSLHRRGDVKMSLKELFFNFSQPPACGLEMFFKKIN